MAEPKPTLKSVDPVWDRIRAEAEEVVTSEPLMASMVHAGVLHHKSLEKALAYRLALKLSSGEISESILRDLADQAMQADSELGFAARADLLAVFDRDPACHRVVTPLLFFSAFDRHW